MVDQNAARAALREFLLTRRARITPADAGLPSFGARRRVAGLRREEVALLAGISPEYYVRLERGTATGISRAIVDAVATALRLDRDERMHIDRLLSALTLGTRRKRRPVSRGIGAGIRVLLDSLGDLPAVVFNGRLDIVATNDLGRALYGSHFDHASGNPNAARFLFDDVEGARQFWPQWEKLADDVVAILRVQAGLNPNDPELVELIGHLSTRSNEFRVRWASNDVRSHRSGVKVFRHPLIGELTLPADNLMIDSANGLVLTVFTPPPGSREHDALRVLASWIAHPSMVSEQSQPGSSKASP